MNPIQTLESLIGKTISGRELKEILRGIPLLKFMNDNDQHYGMTYHDGLNVDVLPFNPNDECSQGGLYVTSLCNYINYYNEYGCYARRVSVSDNALIYVER